MTRQTEETASATETTPRKHCWECLRRRLVCDSARPVCNRCRSNGIVCPGYGEQQPLRWVQPGRVTARNRNRRQPKAIGGAQGARARKTTKTKTTDDASDSNNDGDDDNSDAAYETALMTKCFSALMEPRALKALMRYDINCDNFIGLRASYDCKYNVEIYERCSPLKSLLGEARFKLPLASVASVLPAPIKALFILFALGYQIHNLPRDTGEDVRATARSAVAFWTYQGVRKLNEDLNEEKTRTSDGTMTSVLMVMMADQQLQPSPRWRFHYKGLMKMAQLRGGVEKIWNDCEHMRSGILTWIIGEVFANTTSPRHDQVNDLSHPKNLEFLEMAWGNGVPPVYIGSICPTQLFTTVIFINHLRGLAARGIVSADSSSSSPASSSSPPSSSSSSSLVPSSPSSSSLPPIPDPQTLLNRILSFSPEAYAALNGTDETRANWLLVGRIYQSATVLFCILSLQSASLFPSFSSPSSSGSNKALSRAVRLHYDRLLVDLKFAYRHAHFKNCFFWALVVAGACAGSAVVRGSAFERAFVADSLAEAVCDVGNSMPLLARRVLMAFWESGKTAWDECFDQPYLFLM
ncbi:hypothetical protein GGR51DRAFT_566416 [Nemania sp. FL0031]|nr:hypothetical protein GGR51DRAFT_566416 [Nemania sp. FL0031]